MQTDLGLPWQSLARGCVSLVRTSLPPPLALRRPGARVNGRRAQGWGGQGQQGLACGWALRSEGCPRVHPLER